MPIEHLYARYQRIARNLPRRIRWLALVFAPTSTSFTVFTAGLLNVAGALMITAGIGQVTSGERTPGSAIWLLIFAFLAESLGYWVKERQELILTIAVRQLTYRRFRDIFSRSSHPPEAHGHVLTYPGQISQFASLLISPFQPFRLLPFSRLRSRYMVQAAQSLRCSSLDWYSSASVSSTWWADYGNSTSL